mmetsp:Transcript_64537/g.209516  ORF Transcript_64537/g.209516 Transcript_64537/m.209516 type:complete len:354 (+) Transcript_64537:225-1286(+)
MIINAVETVKIGMPPTIFAAALRPPLPAFSRCSSSPNRQATPKQRCRTWKIESVAMESLAVLVQLLPVLSDVLVLLRGGHRLVAAELHGELTLALCDRAQLGGVSEHPSQRHDGFDQRSVAADGAGVLDGALPAVHGLQRGRLELRGEADGHRHERLQHHGPSLVVKVVEGALCRGLEGFRRGVDLVCLAILKHAAHVDQRVASEQSLRRGGAKALLDGGDIVGRDLVSCQAADELDAVGVARLLLLRDGLEKAHDLAVLASAARLALVQVLEGGLLRDRLAVVHLGLARHQGLDLVLALHPLAVDLQVQLAHARNDRLVRLLLHIHPERRILALKSPERLLKARLVLPARGD